MTTEEDFQKALDKDPTDWQTRLVFSDWLEERGDVRASGYRALGLLRKVPAATMNGCFWFWKTYFGYPSHILTGPWWDAFYRRIPDGPAVPGKPFTYLRRTIEDTAALAFMDLTAPEQEELLTTPSPLLQD